MLVHYGKPLSIQMKRVNNERSQDDGMLAMSEETTDTSNQNIWNLLNVKDSMSLFVRVDTIPKICHKRCYCTLQ